MKTFDFDKYNEYSGDIRDKYLVPYFYPQIAYEGHFTPLYYSNSRGSAYMQKELGIDTTLVIAPKTSIAIEEKNVTKRWGSIVIETYSKLEERIPGWIYKSKADILLWTFPIIRGREIFWIDMKQLQNWWDEINIEQFKIIDSQNDGYITRCRKVPIKVLIKNNIRILRYILQKNNLYLKEKFNIRELQKQYGLSEF